MRVQHRAYAVQRRVREPSVGSEQLRGVHHYLRELAGVLRRPVRLHRKLTNGTMCIRPGQTRGTCWAGACVLPAYFSGCNTAADCVPGGCTGPGGFCLGTVDVAGQVSCSANTGSYVVCPASQGCSAGPTTGQVECGDGTGTGTGTVTCDGPNDCTGNNDCCAYPASGSHCTAQAQPGVIGSGCPSVGPGAQLPVLCDPLNPTAHCPAGKSCVNNVGAQVSFLCQ